jgi:hypothetical protein
VPLLDVIPVYLCILDVTEIICKDAIILLDMYEVWYSTTTDNRRNPTTTTYPHTCIYQPQGWLLWLQYYIICSTYS